MDTFFWRAHGPPKPSISTPDSPSRCPPTLLLLSPILAWRQGLQAGSPWSQDPGSRPPFPTPLFSTSRWSSHQIASPRIVSQNCYPTPATTQLNGPPHPLLLNWRNDPRPSVTRSHLLPRPLSTHLRLCSSSSEHFQSHKGPCPLPLPAFVFFFPRKFSPTTLGTPPREFYSLSFNT